MIRTMSLSLLAGAAISSGAASIARAEASTPAGPSTDEIRALVADMLADAETRSSLLQSGATAGHDGKFFLASPDGAFRLNIGGQLQFRYIANFRDEGGGDGETENDDFESGFQNRRIKLRFDGTIYDDFFFKVQSAFGRDGGNNRLEDAYFGYEFENGLKVQAGQFKLPFAREELVSSKYQLASERSFVGDLFTGNRSQGVMFSYEQERWRAAFAFSDGFNALNTDFNDNFNRDFNRSGEADFGVTGRVEFLGSGNWKQFEDFTSPRGSEKFAWMVGGAVHFQDGASDRRPGAIDGGSLLTWTADVSLEGNGWNLYGAVYGRHPDRQFTESGAPSSDEFGFIAHGGYYVTDKIEPFARYEILIPDSGSGFNVLTAGVNYYIHGHAAKFTLDVVVFLDAPDDAEFDGIRGFDSQTGSGFLGSGNVEQDEVVARAQFQLLF